MVMVQHRLYGRRSAVREARITSWAAVLPGLLLAACASEGPQTLRENLDPETGNTAVSLPRPMELLAETSRGPQRDPFAQLAPFEVDRMGEHRRFLWVSVPEDNGAVSAVQVLCEGQPVATAPGRTDLKLLGLTRPPYEPAAPWSGEWYLPVAPAALDCLARAPRVTVISHLDSGSEERFSAEASDLRPLASFVSQDTALR